MLISNPTVVRGIYENHDYFDYPEMKHVLDETIKNPSDPIEIPSNFMSKKEAGGGFFHELLTRVADTCRGIFISLKCTFDKEYAAKHTRAIHQIEAAYSKKVSDISNLANTIMCYKEPIQKSKELVIELQGRIKELKDNVKTGQGSLEEMIDAKNLVIKDARALLELENKPPGITDIFWNMVAMFTSYQHDPGKKLIEEIHDMDASFPTDNITEELIAAYENEQAENSLLINNINILKKNISCDQQLLAREEEILVQAQALLVKAVEQIAKARQEIENLQLDDYFSEEDLEIPDIATSGTAAPPKELSPKERMLEDIGEDIASHTGVKELSSLFKVLLARLPEDAVTSWNCDDKGNFTLQLKECYPLWMPGSMKGGAVLLFGYPQNGVIKGRLEKNKFNFDSGISSYVNVFPLGYIYPTLDSIHFADKTDIGLKGSYLGQADTKHKTYSQLKKEWESGGVLIDSSYQGGYQKFLAEKIAQS